MTAKGLIAEARRLSGGDPTGALRLVVLRLGRQRPEDASVRAAFSQSLPLSEEPSAPLGASAQSWEGRLLAAGYAPLPDRPQVWRGRHSSRATAAQT